MKTLSLRCLLAVTLFLLLPVGCGYYFPSVYDGPTRTIYLPQWKNRTSKLGIDITFYKTLAKWFRQSEAIVLTKDKSKADLILAGEIVSIDLPSVSWGGDTVTTDVKIKLGVRYVLKDLHTDKLLWEVPSQTWTEDYPAKTLSTSAENQALTQIIDNLAEHIYLGTLDKLRRLNRQAQTTP